MRQRMGLGLGRATVEAMAAVEALATAGMLIVAATVVVGVMEAVEGLVAAQMAQEEGTARRRRVSVEDVLVVRAQTTFAEGAAGVATAQSPPGVALTAGAAALLAVTARLLVRSRAPVHEARQLAAPSRGRGRGRLPRVVKMEARVRKGHAALA